MIRIFKGCILLFLMSGQFFYFEPFWPSGLPISSSKYLSFSWAWIALWTFPHGWVQISWTYLLTDLFAGVFDKSSALYGPVCSLPSYGVKPIAPSRAPRTPDTWLLPSSSYFTISSLRFPFMTLSLVFLWGLISPISIIELFLLLIYYFSDCSHSPPISLLLCFDFESWLYYIVLL